MSILASGLLAAAIATGAVGLRHLHKHLSSGRSAEAAERFRAFQSVKYFGGLDALRAFSVLAVIWTHATHQHSIALLDQGHRGVDLFFAISGFLVTSLLLREYRRDRAISLRDFYMRRTLRIFPLYYAVIALYCVLVFLTLKGSPKAEEFWSNLPAFVSYTTNWFLSVERDGAASAATFYFSWSLASEEQFYILWPLVMVLVLRWVPRPIFLVAPLAVLLGVHMVGASLEDSFAARVMESLRPAILFGVLFAVLMDDEASFKGVYALLGRRWVAPAAAGLMLLCLAAGAPWLVSCFSMAVLVASVCLREDTYLHPVLRFRPLVYLGTISYGVYLMHMLAVNASRKVLGHEFGADVVLLTIPVVILMASASYYLFERPILRYKSLFTPVPEKGTASPQPAEAAPASVLGATAMLGVTSPSPE